MGRVKSALPRNWTLEDVWKHLGVPLNRIRMFPAAGSATERDLLAVHAHEGRLCELIDGVLVEKTNGATESLVTWEIGQRMGAFVKEGPRGILLLPDGFLRLLPGQVRAPDLAFISFDQLPNRKFPAEPIPDLVPRLAVEVLSAGNTKQEMDRKLRDYFVAGWTRARRRRRSRTMDRKLRDYFVAGVELVWVIDPAKRQGRIYTAPDEFRLVTEHEAMDGGDVLPGFRLPLSELFGHTEGAR